MISIPVWYVPRDYQIPIWHEMAEKMEKRRALLVWPRRAGKDLTAFNIMVKHALTVRAGNYYYFLPSYRQGQKVIWDGKIKDGRPFLSCIPGYEDWIAQEGRKPVGVIENIDKRDMKIYLNGPVGRSLIQVIGVQDVDSIVGTNPVGLVFSEFSVDPKYDTFWNYMRPILRENDGWAIFIYTARGLNHGWRLYEKVKNRPTWHTEFHTCETLKHDGKRIITDEDIAEEIADGMPEEMVAQEFYNDFFASNFGAYYGPQMRRLKQEGRIGMVPWDPAYPVHTSWDIGHRDATAIWFFQIDGAGNVNVIDTYSCTGEGLLHYLKELKARPYVYGTHFAPHDMQNKNFQTGKSTLEIALQHGIRFTVVPKIGIHEGIDAVRALLPRCKFDEVKCFDGLEALRQYTKEESGLQDMHGRPIFRDQPKHDWTSHYADSFRYMAVAIDKILGYSGFVDSNGTVLNLPDMAIHEYDALEF